MRPNLPEMTHPKPRRKATPAQARFLENRRRWTRIRLNAWKTMPEKMEAIRREATKMAARRKDEKNDLIRRVANYWPEDMTTSELRERIALDLDYRGKRVVVIGSRLSTHNGDQQRTKVATWAIPMTHGG